MHQKNSEPQIGKDSAILFPQFPDQHSQPARSLQFQIEIASSSHGVQSPPCSPRRNINYATAPHKRPITSSSLSHSRTFHSLHPSPSRNRLRLLPSAGRISLFHLRRLHLRLRLILLLSFPSAFLFLRTEDRSLLFSFLHALIFSSVILLLLFLLHNLIPLPSLRLLLARASSSLLPRHQPPHSRRQSPPVLWSIGSSANPKTENQTLTGYCVQIYSNGDVYEGEFHKGKCSGSGVYYYYMSGRYEGDWIAGKYDGHGVETWARGSRYRGQYHQGLRHGFGVYRFYTGDVYAGEWSNGQSHGCGVHTCEDGSRYVGEFKWGVKHGLGHYHFRNGDMYAGEYFGDKMHGFGVYKFGNGHCFEGSWHEGRRQGLGMYTFRQGETQSGHWNCGSLSKPTTQDELVSLSTCSLAVNHSKVLNALQEARRAAERAYNLPRVDERVNKAVVAANRAACAARVSAVKAVQNRVPGGGELAAQPPLSV